MSNSVTPQDWIHIEAVQGVTVAGEHQCPFQLETLAREVLDQHHVLVLAGPGLCRLIPQFNDQLFKPKDPLLQEENLLLIFRHLFPSSFRFVKLGTRRMS